MGIFGPVIKTPSEVSKKIIIDAACAIGIAEGDLVYYSTTVANTVEKALNTNYATLVIGVVVEKPTTTTCKVQMAGPLELYSSGLSLGRPVFVGTAGEMTTAVPISGSRQIIGMAYDTNKVLLSVQLEKVIR